MRDPLALPPAIALPLLQPFAQRCGLLTIPFHVHEIAGSFLFYTSIFLLISPILSVRLFHDRYNCLPQKTRVAWHVRVVSTIQSTLICILALYIIFVDQDRQKLGYEGRLWGYSGASGMVQAFAAGYFLWDVFVSLQHIGILGPGSLAHAVAALLITCIGFQPFANYYGLNFILYELSTPCLNIHWFLDKFGYTGTNWQLINGICLMATFLGCRLVWGSYQSWNLYIDVWSAWTKTTSITTADGPTYLGMENLYSSDPSGVNRNHALPIWLLLAYLISNTLLSFLNFYWFGKMIQALRKRFTATSKPMKQA